MDTFEDPSPELEQYVTPVPVAAEILHHARQRGDLTGRVLDLGCGPGTFALGAALLGHDAVGVDVDPDALATARRNARNLGVAADFIRGDVATLDLQGDIVIQNPPFGAQTRGADRPFIEAAVDAAPVAYTLHNGGTGDFVETYAADHGARAERVATYRFPLPRTQTFHTAEVETVTVDLYRLTQNA